MPNPPNEHQPTTEQDRRVIQQNAQRLSNQGDDQGAANLSALLELIADD
jgi:hypothetical protein